MKEIQTVESGKCPYCENEEIDYALYRVFDSNGFYIAAQCVKCKGKWRDMYNIEFSGIEDSDGNYHNIYFQRKFNHIIRSKNEK